jgi:hypothetical protein
MAVETVEFPVKITGKSKVVNTHCQNFLTANYDQPTNLKVIKSKIP